MRDKADVVIAGAGPAGLTAAKILADGGKDVLVLEKLEKKKIGDKCCNGTILRRAMRMIPDSLYEKTFDSAVLQVGESKYRLYFGEDSIATLNRHELGQYQLKEANKAGAEVRADTKVMGLDKDENRVILRDGEIKYDYLISADGSTSVIRRSLGFKRLDILRYYKYRVKNELEDVGIGLINLEEIGGVGIITYAPHKNYGDIGFGYFPRLCREKNVKDNKDKFEWYCEENGIDLEEKKFCTFPMEMEYHGFKHKNIFLTGDAAGFHFIVFGIYAAMKSGEIAAKAILNPDWNYETELKDLLRFQRIRNFASFIDTHPNFGSKFLSSLFSLNNIIGPFLERMAGEGHLVGKAVYRWLDGE